MQILKKYLLIIVLLIVVAILWVGSYFVSEKSFVPINPNATSYTKGLKSSFDQDILNDVSDRTAKSFPVAPQEFLDLDTESN